MVWDAKRSPRAFVDYWSRPANGKALAPKARAFAPETCWDAEQAIALEAFGDPTRLERISCTCPPVCDTAPELAAPRIERVLQSLILGEIRLRFAHHPTGIPAAELAEMNEFLDLATLLRRFDSEVRTYRHLARERGISNGRMARHLARGCWLYPGLKRQHLMGSVEFGDVLVDTTEELEASGCALAVRAHGAQGSDQQAAHYIAARLLGQDMAVDLVKAMDALVQQVESFRVWHVLLG